MPGLYDQHPDFLGHTFGGVLQRRPSESERQFFASSGVPAYAAEDNAVVFNPFASFGPAQRKSLEMNEAARVWMRQNQLRPNFAITPQQTQSLSGTAYAGAGTQDIRETLAARLLAGDPSAGAPSAEQDAFVKRLRYAMGIQPMRGDVGHAPTQGIRNINPALVPNPSPAGVLYPHSIGVRG